MSLPSPDDPQISPPPLLPSSQGPQVTSPSPILPPSAPPPPVPPPPFSSPPLPATGGVQFLPDSLQAVSISSVRAALEKLEINIPVDDVLTAICHAEAKRTDQLSEIAPPPQPTDLQIITSSNSPKPQAEIFDLERRRRLSRLAKEGFPHGVPDPFVLT